MLEMSVFVNFNAYRNIYVDKYNNNERFVYNDMVFSIALTQIIWKYDIVECKTKQTF